MDWEGDELLTVLFADRKLLVCKNVLERWNAIDGIGISGHYSEAFLVALGQDGFSH